MLTISTEKAGYIIVRARQFDVKVPSDDDGGSNPTDDAAMEALEELPDDTSETELQDAIRQLNRDEQIDLVAVTWIGRGDYDAGDFASARQDAADRWNQHTAEYLAGMPLLADYLEEGLDSLGVEVREDEDRR